jgi:hypothetical protein
MDHGCILLVIGSAGNGCLQNWFCKRRKKYRHVSWRHSSFSRSVLGVLALLVGNTAAGLAGRLARGLALAAAAIGSAVTEIAGLQGDDMFHFVVLQKVFFRFLFFIPRIAPQVKICASFFAEGEENEEEEKDRAGAKRDPGSTTFRLTAMC